MVITKVAPMFNPSSDHPQCGAVLLLFRRTVMGAVIVNLVWLSALSQVRAAGIPTGLAPVHLRVQYKRNPIGICAVHPQLTWMPPQEYTFIREADDQIEVARSAAGLVQSRNLLWNSGQCEYTSDWIPRYHGPALDSFTRYYWRVRVWNGNGRVSPWSKPAEWMTGPLHPSDWRGEWITYTHQIANRIYRNPPGPSFVHSSWILTPGSGHGQSISPGFYTLYRRFTLPTRVKLVHAVLICAADDEARVAVNGSVLGGFSSRFDHPGSFNITAQLRPGVNRLAVLVKNLGDTPNPCGLLAALRVRFSNGRTFNMTTDARWRAVAGKPVDWRSGIPPATAGSAHIVARYGQGPWGRPRPPGQAALWLQKSPSPIFRKIFIIHGAVSHAYAYISGLGFYVLRINGRRVSRDVLVPGFVDYRKQVPFLTYTLSKYLKSGKNIITISLGNGWFNECEADIWNFNRAPWRATPRVLMNMLIEKANGSRQWLATNAGWQAADGPRLVDGVRTGEVYDAKLRIKGWNRASFAGSSLAPARTARAPRGRMTAWQMPPCRVRRVFKPVSVTELPGHTLVVKFPDNIAGWVTLTADGTAGRPIVLKYGERLKADGLVSQNSIKGFVFTGAFQTDTYIPADTARFTWHPEFTYHGFQYVQIRGLTGRSALIRIRADAISAAFNKIGSFACANPLLNNIARITDRTYRNNFLSFPTDCPTREKCGWTGDGWLAAAQGLCVFHNTLGYMQWLNDFADWQQPDGNLYCIIPNSNGWGGGNLPDWDSAYIIVNWYLYLYDGDAAVLAEHYAGMKRYFDYISSTVSHNIMSAGQGDWASPSARPPPVPVTSTAIYYEDAVLLTRISRVLGHRGQAAFFSHKAAAIRRAFNRAFYRGHGVYSNGGQTAQAVALYYHLVQKSNRAAALRRLVADVRTDRGHLDVGVLGSKAIFRALAENGRQNMACAMLTKTTYPSYGFWIRHGATTLWENWSATPGSMDHIMFGDVNGWFYNDLVGIKPMAADPGWGTILFHPRPVRTLGWARASVLSRFGRISAGWMWKGPRLLIRLVIPPGSAGQVVLPTSRNAVVSCNGKPLAEVTGPWLKLTASGDKELSLPPGKYHFAYLPSGSRKLK